eukprot:Nitzschia sp. Nitz4//scaffold40_size135432//123070//125583//NITZ4_003270-RA/size135432-processed-gene-0.182-mRNA-1//-1//CDS//3329551297//4098//frame0
MDTTLATLVEELAKDSTFSADRCLDITSSPAFAKSVDADRSLSEKLLSKMMKGLRARKRSSDGTTAAKWEKVIQLSSRLLSTTKEPVTKAKPNKSSGLSAKQKDSSHQGLPKTASEYKSRIEKHKKKMYKNPPALPPPTIAIEEHWYPLPERDEESGELKFKGGGNDIKYLIKEFTPNRTPEEVLRAGSFGGTYFRPITSAVTNLQYDAKEVLQDTVDPAWIAGLDESRMLTSSVYRTEVNKYGVKCGGCLGMWESSGWIADSDPYGWFQWYCRFYQENTIQGGWNVYIPQSMNEALSTLDNDLAHFAMNDTSSVHRCLNVLSSLDSSRCDPTGFQDLHTEEKLCNLLRNFEERKSHCKQVTAAKWDEAISLATRLLAITREGGSFECTSLSLSSCSDQPRDLPKSVSVDKARFDLSQKKYIMHSVLISTQSSPLPARDSDTGELSFSAHQGECSHLIGQFHPNRTPEEMLRAGVFGGTYFRTGENAGINAPLDAMELMELMGDTVDPSWIDGMDVPRMLTSNVYRVEVNKYGVKCSETSGDSDSWLADHDPYGWLQWYCRFYQGQRCSDDGRQINRWLMNAGPDGKIRVQLCENIIAEGADFDDVTTSPAERQTLLHWGIEMTPQMFRPMAKQTLQQWGIETTLPVFTTYGAHVWA